MYYTVTPSNRFSYLLMKRFSMERSCNHSIDVDDDDIVHHQVINDAMISTRLLFSVTPENLAEVHFVARSLDGLTDATAIGIEDD